MPLAANTNGGCAPLLSVGAGHANTIAAGYKDIDPEQVRAVIIPLFASLGSATVGGAVTQTGYDTYRVPTTHDLVIEEIRAHLVFTTAGYVGEDDIVVDTNFTPGRTIQDRLVMKATNCLIDLKNSDREQKVIDNHSMCLASLHPLAGGEPLRFGSTPHKVPAGETLRFDAQLRDTTAASGTGIASGTMQYGILLVGKLVRVAKS